MKSQIRLNGTLACLIGVQVCINGCMAGIRMAAPLLSLRRRPTLPNPTRNPTRRNPMMLVMTPKMIRPAWLTCPMRNCAPSSRS